MKKLSQCIAAVFICLLLFAGAAVGESSAYKDKVYQPGKLKPRDSIPQVKPGDPAPDFTLPSISGAPVRLTSFLGRKNIMLTFIPAAWTPVCSDQWPGYNIAEELFVQHDTILIGISVDNIPTLFAWTREMGELWFEVVSDFWPHGEVSRRYGVLRSDGMSERAIIIIDKKGVVRFVHVEDINIRPDLGMLMEALEKITRSP